MGAADRPGRKLTDDDLWDMQSVQEDVWHELKASMEKHAGMHSPHEGISVIREEFEELWDHVKADTGRTSEARKEALQLAAMAVRYIIDLIDNDNRSKS